MEQILVLCIKLTGKHLLGHDDDCLDHQMVGRKNHCHCLLCRRDCFYQIYYLTCQRMKRRDCLNQKIVQMLHGDHHESDMKSSVSCLCCHLLSLQNIYNKLMIHSKMFTNPLTSFQTLLSISIINFTLLFI